MVQKVPLGGKNGSTWWNFAREPLKIPDEKAVFAYLIGESFVSI